MTINAAPACSAGRRPRIRTATTRSRFTVTDNGTGTLSDSETFTITVGEVNVAPVLDADRQPDGRRS